ncbi:X-ray repair cross-complementing protein 5-like [Anopheles maculipalpis]|uniref:X-ray repair cross-complementing protein 5-like n=1 Tax=Anopheles maculipalpis TaxID=1496333 RepID=UPI00215954FF|nr:X-ray repair cross-complementing protein 5-like [Anopheles maculipalpis]
MARASGKAHMIVLDVGQSTAIATGNDKQSFFQKSKVCVSLIMQRLIFSAPNDHVGVVLYGTKETNNQLNVEIGGYEHITEAFELQQANWQTLRIMQNQVTRSNLEACWFDALIVATNVLKSETMGKKFTECSIILISPFYKRADVAEDQLSNFLDGLRSMHGVLHLITNFVLHPAASVGTIFTTSGAFDEQAHKSEARSANERWLKQVLKDTNGTVSNINWAERMLAFFDPKLVRPTPWNSVLSIGTKVNLSISAYVMISEQKGLGSFKVDSVDDSSKVEMKTQYFLNDKQMEISMEDIIMGYMYGSTAVPYDNTIDIEYRSGDARLACLGFTASSNILEEHLSSKGSHVVVAKKGCTASNHKLAALVKAMDELQVTMIATKVYRKDTRPRLNALLPTYRNEIPCLVMLELIFQDEVCCLNFPRLLKSKPKPTDEQYEAIGKLIDSMNLMDAVDDSNGESREAFALNSTYNPTLQHVYRAVAHRAVNPKQPLPAVLDGSLQELITVPKKVSDRSKPALEEVKRLFELKEIKQNTRAEWLQRMAKVKLDDDATSTVSTIDSGIMMEDDDADRRTVVSVGTLTPAEDFALLLRRGEKFATVASQLQSVLFELLFTSMRPPGDKVVAALAVYRSEAQNLGPYRYNEWITEFKDMLLTRGKRAFWEEVIVGKQLGLIDSQQSEMSTVSVEHAANFYKTPTQNNTTVESSGAGDDIDADSLFDELNGSF